jgi:hypothetical protein
MSVATCCCESSRGCGIARAVKESSHGVMCSFEVSQEGLVLRSEASKVARSSKGGRPPSVDFWKPAQCSIQQVKKLHRDDCKEGGGNVVL